MVVDSARTYHEVLLTTEYNKHNNNDNNNKT